MISLKKVLCSLLAISAIAATMGGCVRKIENDPADISDFQFSAALTEDGRYSGIDALDYVTLPEGYRDLEIPKEEYMATEEDIDYTVEYILSGFTTSKEVTDRALVDGDTVNIDYVGSIGGVEFEGGSTQGAGSEVIIGVTPMIDDFLEQLIGHIPGENFDIEVTFPENYGVDELNGKDAVFNITINHIVEYEFPELNDDFVAENLSDSYGWNTVDDMKAEIEKNVEYSKKYDYTSQYMMDNAVVSEVPQDIIDYQISLLVKSYSDMVAQMGVTLDDYLATIGVEDIGAFVEQNMASVNQVSRESLIRQAYVEDLEITVDDEYMLQYFEITSGVTDLEMLTEVYGEPYLKMVCCNNKVVDEVMGESILD